MNKLFKTFWHDNKLIIGIILLVLFVVSFVMPTAFLSVLKLNNPIETSYFNNQETISISFGIFMLFIMMVATGLLIPGTSIYISLRTTKGAARLRYNTITTSRLKFSFFNLLMYLLLSIAIFFTIIIGLLLVALIFQVNLYLNITDIFNFIMELDFGVVLMIFSWFLSFIFSFYYWQLMFVLPHTKTFRKIPFTGMIFIIIGIYVTFQVVMSIMDFVLLINGNSSSGFNLVKNILLIGSVGTLYHYLFAKEYEY